MKFILRTLLTVTAWLVLAGCASGWKMVPPSPPSPAVSPNQTQFVVSPLSTLTPNGSPTPMPAPLPVVSQPRLAADLFSLISLERMFDTLVDLTHIEAYSGWRNSASQGEREAIYYLKDRLGELETLNRLGLTTEIQRFKVFLGTDLWETHLYLTVNGQETEVPTDGLRGPRDNIPQALRFDSDGALNDAEPNPVEVSGPIILVRTEEEIKALSPAEVQGKIIFLDYTVIDRALSGIPAAVTTASEVIGKGPAGLVLVTRFSNEINQSHGTFIGDVSALNWVTGEANPPTLYVRLEDLAPAGINTWEDLARVEAARLNWDADVFSPGLSHNLIARLPGADTSQAVLLTAHIDSANTPGALDDAAGSAVLLEVARILDAAGVQPEVDIYLVWFGSQALGFYGSYNFVAHHQELLDRTLALLQVDSLGYPLEGITANLNLVTWSYGRLGHSDLTWPNYLAEAVRPHGVEIEPANLYELESDNTAFTAFDVPNANLIYLNRPRMEEVGGFHYAAHSHDPYDTAELVLEQADLLEKTTQIALTAVLNTSQEKPHLRVTPPARHRALFIGTHTEAVHMTPAAFTDLGMALAMEGFDVDQVPFGQPVTLAELADADLVIALPPVDYPSPDGDPSQYDTAWGQAEIDRLEAYVEQGGLLVLTNSAHRLKYGNWAQDPNEDWQDMNDLATRFGITYYGRALSGRVAQVTSETPLTDGLSSLNMAENNGVAFILDQTIQEQSQVQAWVGDDPAVALVNYGEAGGQVLVLADLGILNADWNHPPTNLPFWQHLARYSVSIR